MSVWCTRLSSDADDFPGDGPGPLIYHGSHIIPTADGERGGGVDTAHLPAFISRDGYGADEEDGLSWWPYLRLSVTPVQRPGLAAYKRLRALADRLEAEDPQLAADVRLAADMEDTVVLDLPLVDALIADLTEWRAGVNEERET